MTRKTFGRLMVLSGLLTATFLSPFATANTPPAATAQKPLRLLSYNIRCGYCEPAGSANHWDTRKFLVAHQMKQIQADVIGLQEAELFQIDDLLAMLPEYASYGLGRDDGKRQGESTAVLYRKDQFELIHSRTLWLSPTPQQVSLGWGATINRTLTITGFRWRAATMPDLSIDSKSASDFYLLNTHFDHQSDPARMASSELVINEINQLPKDKPILLSGDFNLNPQHPAYQRLSTVLADAGHSSRKPSAELSTFNAFGQPMATNPGKIDHIFLRGPVKVEQQQIDQRRYLGLYPSDHYPVIADLLLE